MTISKEFLEKCRHYLSTSTSRTTPYAYFNFIDNTVILSNSTSGGSEHGDRLMDFSVGELGFHYVEFKDTEFLNEFKTFFKIPSDDFFCVHIVNLFSLLNTIRIDCCDVLITDDGSRVLTPKGVVSYSDKNIFGFYIRDFHVIKVIRDHASDVARILRPDFDKVEYTVDLDPKITGGLYFTSIPVSLFVKNGQPIFNKCLPEIKILGMDGLSTVNLGTFIKKLKKPYTLKRFLWVKDKCVYSLAIFEDDVCNIISYRPNVVSIPISNECIAVHKVKK